MCYSPKAESQRDAGVSSLMAIVQLSQVTQAALRNALLTFNELSWFSCMDLFLRYLKQKKQNKTPL